MFPFWNERLQFLGGREITSALVWPQAAYLHFGVTGLRELVPLPGLGHGWAPNFGPEFCLHLTNRFKRWIPCCLKTWQTLDILMFSAWLANLNDSPKSNPRWSWLRGETRVEPGWVHTVGCSVFLDVTAKCHGNPIPLISLNTKPQQKQQHFDGTSHLWFHPHPPWSFWGLLNMNGLKGFHNMSILQPMRRYSCYCPSDIKWLVVAKMFYIQIPQIATPVRASHFISPARDLWLWCCWNQDQPV